MFSDHHVLIFSKLIAKKKRRQFAPKKAHMRHIEGASMSYTLYIRDSSVISCRTRKLSMYNLFHVKQIPAQNDSLIQLPTIQKPATLIAKT
jgi:hypothetical protein